jgi:predicted aspartyl protease
MRKFAVAVVALSLCASAQALAAETCHLTILTSLDMKMADSGLVFVPMLVGGTKQNMLIDTGGFFSELTGAAVNEMKLTPHHAEIGLIGVSGRMTQDSVTTSFVLGNIHAEKADFMVFLKEDESEHMVPDTGGTIAPNLLIGYDVEFDFATKKVYLLSQEHCDGEVIHWQADALAVIPMIMTRALHIKVPVKLDGHEYLATLDTGASVTTVNLNRATRDFALKPGDADTPANGNVRSDKASTIYTHRFRSLDLDGIAVSNPLITLLPDLVRNQMGDTGPSPVQRELHTNDPYRDAGLPDMILGMDIMHHLHFYIAYKEKKLYVTPSGVPAMAPLPFMH